MGCRRIRLPTPSLSLVRHLTNTRYRSRGRGIDGRFVSSLGEALGAVSRRDGIELVLGVDATAALLIAGLVGKPLLIPAPR
jgi:hypothetical protein